MSKNKTGERPPLDNTELRRRQKMRTRIHAEQTIARAAEEAAARAAIDRRGAQEKYEQAMAEKAASYETIAELWRPSQRSDGSS